jgi:hypothetical protein
MQAERVRRISLQICIAFWITNIIFQQDYDNALHSAHAGFHDSPDSPDKTGLPDLWRRLERLLARGKRFGDSGRKNFLVRRQESMGAGIPGIWEDGGGGGIQQTRDVRAPDQPRVP